MHRQRAGVRYRMVHPYKFYRHTAHFNVLLRRNYIKTALVENTVLFKLSLYQSESKPRSVDRNVYLFEQVGKSAYMILRENALCSFQDR